MPAGRKRTNTNLPGGIDPAKLPPRVSYKSKEGYWRIGYTDESGKRRQKRLCGKNATLSHIWQAVENLSQPQTLTFKGLSTQFQQSHGWQKLAHHTQRDYLSCHKAICNTATKQGKFGDLPIAHWKTSTVLKYRDKRGETSESRANKELAYMSRVLSWAKLYEKIEKNVADGVPKFSIAPRQHYTEDRDYHFFLQTAQELGYWYLPFVIEIAYECRLRPSEPLDLTDANELAEGLYVKRRKGSKDGIIYWSDNLRKLWDTAKAKRNAILTRRKQPMPIQPNQRPIFISERGGDKITYDALRSAKRRTDAVCKQKAERLGITWVHFTIHDMKRRAATDFVGDKMLATGHRSQNMLKIYDVSVPSAKTTTESKHDRK